MFTFVGTCKRHGCYADDGVGLGLGWGCLRSLELADAMDVTLMMGWVWGCGGDVHIRWNLHTADDGVGLGLGWGCLRSLELADAMDVTLMMGWVWGWGGDVHVRWNLHTPWMLRWWWGEVGVGVGVGIFTFVGTCKRHGCCADDGVGLGLGWGCSRSLELAHAMDVTLMMGWGWGWGGDVYVCFGGGSLVAYWSSGSGLASLRCSTGQPLCRKAKPKAVEVHQNSTVALWDGNMPAPLKDWTSARNAVKTTWFQFASFLNTKPCKG